MRRTGLAILAALSAILPSGTKAADEPTAEQAIANYHALTTVAPKRCQRGTDASEIVVCANDLRESQRVPYIAELRAGDRPLRVLGEPPSVSERGSDPPCPIRGCPGGGSVLGALAKALERIRD